MNKMKDGINGLELEKLTQVTKFFGFMDSMSKTNQSSDLVSKISDAIKEGLASLEDVMKKIAADKNTPVATAGPDIADKIKEFLTPQILAAQNTTKPTTAQPIQPPQDLSPLLASLSDIANILRAGIKIKDNDVFSNK